MSEMIERVAKALCASYGEDFLDWRSFAADARAAIEAMREPTLPMIGAAMECADCLGDIWRAMIDEALSK